MMMAGPHFSVSEFTFSETASRHGIDNSCPDDNILDNILITANYMESVRELLNHIVFSIINSDIDYDQLILEYDQWVHISFCEDEKIPRRQALVINKDGTMIYTD